MNHPQCYKVGDINFMTFQFKLPIKGTYKIGKNLNVVYFFIDEPLCYKAL